MTYDRWKTTNPADEWLGPDPSEQDDESENPELRSMTPQKLVKNARDYMASPDARESTANMLVAKMVEEIERLSDENDRLRIALTLARSDMQSAIGHVEGELRYGERR